MQTSFFFFSFGLGSYYIVSPMQISPRKHGKTSHGHFNHFKNIPKHLHYIKNGFPLVTITGLKFPTCSSSDSNDKKKLPASFRL